MKTPAWQTIDKEIEKIYTVSKFKQYNTALDFRFTCERKNNKQIAF